MQVSATLPPWDDVIVFLHKFRPIILQSESTYFHKICNILRKELKPPYLRAMIDLQRDVYSGKKLQTQYQIRVDDVVLNSEKALNEWLNSYEYHRDKGKRTFIASLHTMFPLDASKAIFVNLLIDKAHAVYNMVALIRVVLSKQKSFEGRIQQLD